MRAKRIRALALAAGLIGWSFLVPRFPPRWNSVSHVTLGTALVVVTRAPLGLRPPALRSGLRHGLVAGAVVACGVAATTALPPVRAAMAERELPAATARWLALHVPLGTVWSEEATFRGALVSVAADAFGPKHARLLQAAAFGLWHIVDARSTGQPMVGTVLVTGAAGWWFGWLRERSGSLAAPMLAHLAINEAAGLAALAVQRSRGIRRRECRPPADEVR